MTTITIEITDQVGAKLRQQAQAAGKPVEQLIREVLQTQASAGETLRRISGSLQQRFSESGMSEDELAERLEREDHAARGVNYEIDDGCEVAEFVPSPGIPGKGYGEGQLRFEI